MCEDDPRLSLKHYQAAVDILSSQLKGKQPSAPQVNGSDFENGERERRQTIAKALVSMTEIWLTDLWCEKSCPGPLLPSCKPISLQYGTRRGAELRPAVGPRPAN
jgi:hypothetical protein